MRRRAVLGYGAGGVAARGLTLLAGWWQVDGPGAPARADDRRPLPLTDMEFDLVHHEGRPVSPGMLVGRPSLVFFGFTFCSDVCPTTLADISGWLDELETAADELNVVLMILRPLFAERAPAS